MKWDVKQELKVKSKELRTGKIVDIVLENRGVGTKSQKEEFLSPVKPEKLTPKMVGIDEAGLNKAINRIEKAIKDKDLIIVYGDYDADGITGTAVLWETLYGLGAKALPFIPHRKKHGYGLSVAGVEELMQEVRPRRGSGPQKPGLIITVDNGIVAQDAADYVKKQGIDLIITDHHVMPKKLPEALAIVHTTELSGAGVAFILSKEILAKSKIPASPAGRKNPIRQTQGKQKSKILNLLELAAIGTIADMVALKGANRSIAKFGLEAIRKTKRLGLVALFEQSAIKREEVDTYHINFVIAPRINAMGRLEHGLDSLRLLCTKDLKKAKDLAALVGGTNQTRQDLTQELVDLALGLVGKAPKEKLLIVEHEEFHEGVIGLVAGKLVETYYRPAIVIGRGEKVSKASARSITGVNIIELIRTQESWLVNAGGHPMAAGFTVENEKLDQFKEELMKEAEDRIEAGLLERSLEIDCQIELSDISWDLFNNLRQLEPFGMANARPVFAMKNVEPLEVMKIGQEGKHLKLLLPSEIKGQTTLPALWFGWGSIADKLRGNISLAFSIDENTWNGRTELQLRIRDINFKL